MEHVWHFFALFYAKQQRPNNKQQQTNREKNGERPVLSVGTSLLLFLARVPSRPSGNHGFMHHMIQESRIQGFGESGIHGYTG